MTAPVSHPTVPSGALRVCIQWAPEGRCLQPTETVGGKILRLGKLFVAAVVQKGKQAARGACEPRIKETVMKRKLFVAGMALIGCILLLTGISWAGPGGDGYRCRDGGAYRQGWHTPPCSGCGWQKGGANSHKPAGRTCVPGHRRRHHPKRPVVVEKHVHHYYPVRVCHPEARYSIAATLIDQAFGIYVEARGTR